MAPVLGAPRPLVRACCNFGEQLRRRRRVKVPSPPSSVMSPQTPMAAPSPVCTHEEDLERARPRIGSMCTGYGGLDLAARAVYGGEAWTCLHACEAALEPNTHALMTSQ